MRLGRHLHIYGKICTEKSDWLGVSPFRVISLYSSLYTFVYSVDSAVTGLSTPTTVFDGTT